MITAFYNADVVAQMSLRNVAKQSCNESDLQTRGHRFTLDGELFMLAFVKF